MIDIAVRDLVKEYEVGQPVLNGLTFQVDTGERVGILGRNGAGKTTLFRILTGQDSRSATWLLTSCITASILSRSVIRSTLLTRPPVLHPGGTDPVHQGR